MNFNKIDDCVEILREVSQNKKDIYLNKRNAFFQRRSCNQFNLIISGGRKMSKIGPPKAVKSFQQVDSENFNAAKGLRSMTLARHGHKTICYKDDVYVFGGYDDSNRHILTVEKYSLTTNTWDHVADMPDYRLGFCTCVFADKIFIVGGYFGHFERFNTNSLKFDTKDNTFEDVTRMRSPGYLN